MEVTENDAMAAVKSWPRCFPDCRLRHLKPSLRDSGLLVGWVWSGRRLGSIAERALICKWASTKRLAVAWRIILPIAETMRGGGE